MPQFQNVALYPASQHEHRPKGEGGRDGLVDLLALDELRDDQMPASFREEMASYYKNQSIPFRAVTLYHQNKWNKLKSGDLALLYRVGVYYASARIAFKIHSHGLARAIFPLEDENKMDELFCFFECPVTPIYLPKEHIRPAVLRGFTVIDGATNQTEVNGYERAAKRAAINES